MILVLTQGSCAAPEDRAAGASVSIAPTRPTGPVDEPLGPLPTRIARHRTAPVADRAPRNAQAVDQINISPRRLACRLHGLRIGTGLGFIRSGSAYALPTTGETWMARRCAAR